MNIHLTPHMIVGYGGAESVQRAAVGVWLGTIEPVGKSPVRLPRTVIHDSVPSFSEV